MKEFFGIGGYTRAPEGFMSWQHLVFVSSLMVLMVFFAIWLGKKYKSCNDKKKFATPCVCSHSRYFGNYQDCSALRRGQESACVGLRFATLPL